MANKKINQLVTKTTIQSTDLFPLGDGTTGQLFKKTIADLQAAIGGAVISVNGLVGTVVLDTDDIQELGSPTNRYFTEARARAAISLTTTGNSGASTYSSSTGVLNVPTYTLAGLGGITASFLSGGTGITYNSSTGVIAYSGTVYTDASVRGLVSAGAGLSYNSSTGVFSYSGTVYTDSSIRALISLTTTGSSGASTYNNTTGVLNVPTYTLAGLGGISLNSLSGSAPITYNSSTGAIGITQANTSTNGFLSSTDWNTFNGKQSALTLGNVSEVVSNVLMFPDGQNGKTIGNLSIQVVQAGSTTNGFLSSANWNTFNNKQNAITLTTTGTSGAATFSGGTLNIPQYTTDVSGFVTLTTTQTISGAKTFSTLLTTGSGTVDNTNAITISASTTARTHIGSAFGTTFIQNNNFYNGTAYVYDDNTLGGSVISLGQSISFQTAAANSAPTTKMVVTNAGNVGIGTSSPSQLLEVNNGTQSIIKNVSGTRTLQLESYAADWNYLASTGNNLGINVGGANALVINVNSAERMRITSSGEILAGTTSTGAGYQFHLVRAGSSAFIGVSNQGAGSGDRQLRIGFGGTSSFAQIQGTRNGVADDINLALNPDGAANVLIGTSTNNGEKLYVNGSIRATGSITANSDVRLKKNIERIENALQKVSEISGYTYNTIYDEDRHAGVIAQEIDKVLPEIVNKGNDGLMGVEYGNISALLIEAIKEQKVLIESLQARLTALEK
jgi:hypothetical protein